MKVGLYSSEVEFYAFNNVDELPYTSLNDFIYVSNIVRGL